MMATQPVVKLGSIAFLDRLSRESREQVLVNSTRMRYGAASIAYQAGDADRAEGDDADRCVGGDDEVDADGAERVRGARDRGGW